MKLVLMVLLGVWTAVMQAAPLSFYSLTTKDGLSHNSVISVYQDRRGFMWLGTRDGLNVYDGNEIRSYKFNKDSKHTLTSNHIARIVGDGEDEIYIATDQEVVAFNIATESFRVLLDFKAETISYRDHKLYYACRNGLYVYRDGGSELVCELPEEETVNCVMVDENGIYLGTQHGLFRLEGQGDLAPVIEGVYVFDLFRDSQQQLWVSSYDGKGLFVVTAGGEVKRMRHADRAEGSLSSNYTHRCIEDRNGDIWVGTFNGLNRYDVETGRFEVYRHTNNEKGLTESSIWSLYCDRQGNIWAGTYYGGVNYFNPTRQVFREFYAETNESEGLSVSTVGKMIEDGQQRLWICTEGGGVNRYDLKTGKFKWYRHNRSGNSLSRDNAKCLYYDGRKDELWIGTHMGGLNRLDVKSGNFKVYRHRAGDEGSLPSDIVMDILPYEGDLIVGTYHGIVRMDPETGRCTPLMDGREAELTDEIYKLMLDSRERLWIVCDSRRRVAVYDLKQKELRVLHHSDGKDGMLSTEHVYNVYEDSRQRIWLSTNGYGLDVYDPERQRLENIDVKKNNLISNVVYAVEEIADGRYAISTDQGISIWDSQKGEMANYRRNVELPLSTINEYSLLKASTGEIFVGGMDGMIAFDEKDVERVQQEYRITPSRLWVNSREVGVQDSTAILPTTLGDAEGIELKAGENTFALQYATGLYLPVDRVKLEYQLKGASDLWIPMNEDHYVAFSNLDAGSYVLKVRSVLKNGRVHREHALKVTVHPPFYRSGWAWMLYAVLMIATVWAVVNQYNHRMRLREQLKYEKKNAAELEKMTQSKLRFFTNISHEFRTPLSIITGYVEMILAKREVSGPLRKSLVKVYKNCASLNELISELLDFRKMEQGFMTLKVSRHDLVSYLYENFLLFDEIASERHIDYRFVKSRDEIQVWYDARQMRKVISNLLSNAFKFVSEQGRITVSIHETEEKVTMEVCNSGRGLTKEEMKNIFDRFYQADGQPLANGTGIGLHLTKGIVDLHHGKIGVYSTPGVDTTFYVDLPLGNEHFAAEELIDNNEEIATLWPVALTCQGVDKEPEDAEEPEVMKDENGETRRCTMLVVEDNPQLRGLLVDWFSAFYEVTAAADGEEGLARCRELLPDIVISDVVMPKVSGTELCRILKQEEATCNIPIILLTALTNENYKIEGFELGADDYVCKPFNMQLLLTRANNLVRTRMNMKKAGAAMAATVADRVPVNNIVDQEFMDKARRIVKTYLDHPDFNVNVFAQEMGVSRTLLFMRLKSIANCTPNEFIVEIKMERAIDLLDHHPELNISQISDELGFSTTKQFRRYFKNKYEKTPTEYRNRTAAPAEDGTDETDETD